MPAPITQPSEIKRRLTLYFRNERHLSERPSQREYENVDLWTAYRRFCDEHRLSYDSGATRAFVMVDVLDLAELAEIKKLTVEHWQRWTRLRE